MKKFAIYGPITGRFYIEVEAANETEAIDIMYGVLDNTNIEEWNIGHKDEINIELIKDNRD